MIIPKMVYRDGSQADSVTHYTHAVIEKEKKSTERAWNSIHSSQPDECDKRITLLVLHSQLGIKTLHSSINVSNVMASEAGNSVHTNFQYLFEKAGMLCQVPYVNDDPEKQKEGRDKGWLSPAVELNLWNYLTPCTDDQVTKYFPDVFANLDQDLYNQLRYELFLSIRIDAQIEIVDRKGDKTQLVCDIKSHKEKHFKAIEKYLKTNKETLKNLSSLNEEEKKKAWAELHPKLKRGITQLQIQMHFARNSRTGARIEHGLLYIVNRNDESKPIELYIRRDESFFNHWFPIFQRQARLIKNKEIGESNPSPESCEWCEWNHPDDSLSMCTDPDRYSHVGIEIANRFKKFPDWELKYV